MAQAFYRKWRSQNFGELVGQEHVTKTLLGALRTGRIGHAYLFCGPRGTGKTSTARILAKAVNCLTTGGTGEPCNECASCQAITEGRALDLIEMDAASNRGIDDIRELRERVNFAPNEARYKVYIIDEVHQLTQAAFDALLKTLEEPPRHVIFILATTEAHQVPATILSRCQRFDFRRISLQSATDRLQHICEREQIAIDPAALQLIIRSAAGSLRDAENLLDQVASFYGDRIDIAHVRETLGIPDAELVRRLVAQIVERDIGGGLHTINEVVNRGDDLRHFGRQLVGYLRNVLLIKAGADRWADLPASDLDELRELAGRLSLGETARIIRAFSFSETKQDDLTSLPLELALVEALLPAAEEAAPTPVPEPRLAPAKSRSTPAAPQARPPAPQTAAGSPERPAPRDQVPVPGPPPAAAVPVNGSEATVSPTRDLPATGDGNLGPPATPADDLAAPAAAEVLSGAPPLSVEPPLSGEPPVPAGPPLAAEPAVPTEPVVEADGLERLRLLWPQVLAQLNGKDPRQRRVQALLRDCCRLVAVRDGEVSLAFRYDIHKGRLEEPENRRSAEAAISAVLGAPHRLQCTLETSDVPLDKLAAARNDPLIQEAERQGGRLRRVE